METKSINKSDIANLYCMSCKEHTENTNPEIYFSEENGRRECRVKAECSKKDKQKTPNATKTRKYKDENKIPKIDDEQQSHIEDSYHENETKKKSPRKPRKNKPKLNDPLMNLYREYGMFKIFKDLMSKQQ